MPAMEGGDPHDLARFVVAQRDVYAQVLDELKAGRKRSHWMWFIFPQVDGLGLSAMAQRYAISGVAEARAYLAHEVLGPRLLECVAAVMGHAGVLSAETILGGIDAVKLRSCCTLFERAGGGAPFAACLDAFYGGARDARTLAMTGGSG